MADEHAARNIAPADEVLHRDTVVGRFTAAACLFMVLFFGGLAVTAGVQDKLAGAVGLAFFALVALLFGLARSVLRTVVTRSDVRVRWGLRAVTIPLGAIRDVHLREAGEQSLTAALRETGTPPIEALDLGVPRYAASQGPIAPRSFGHLLDLTWTDASTGKARRAWLGADDPDALLAAIQRARDSATPRLRTSVAEPRA